MSEFVSVILADAGILILNYFFQKFGWNVLSLIAGTTSY
jgi:hypothetical protein